MECKDFKELFIQDFTGELKNSEHDVLNSHIACCGGCKKEYDEFKKMWALMNELPQAEPSLDMSEAFNASLQEYKESITVPKRTLKEIFGQLLDSLFPAPKPAFAFAVATLVFGMVIGYLIPKHGNNNLAYDRQIDSLSAQMSEMRQLIVLSMLQDPSASKRIQAVSFSENIENADEKVITALFTTLNEDPNVNVRLATLEALSGMSNDSRVREGLVKSIALQDSPIMQSAIADVMVKLRETRSVEHLQKLLENKDIDKFVKMSIEQNIQKLI